MPLETLVIDEIKLVVVNATGKITKAELVEYQTSTWIGKKYAGYSSIFNCADADFDEIHVSDLSDFVGNSHEAQTSPLPSRLAIVSNNDYVRQLVKFYEMAIRNTMENNCEIKIFDTVQGAKDWITELETESA